MVQTFYDPEVDALYIRFAPDGVAVERTTEAALEVMVDYDAESEVVGIEVLGVRHRRSTAEALAAMRPPLP